MLFNSYEFIIFFPLVTVLYFLIPHRIRYVWLLICSYFFYMCWNAKYALLLFVSTFITYLSGIAIAKAKQKRTKKLSVAISFILNLSILFFFKYFDFFINNINKILQSLNIEILNPGFSVILPVGISFYIFQALSYTMDVYRKDIKPEKNFLRYALFVSFFPQLVAGPIERSKNLIHQLCEKHSFDFNRAKDGFLIMLWGYFQKLVIADRAAIIVNKIFNNYPTYSGLYIIIGAILFAFQIYCDFSGYSLIAIGSAKIMGFKLMDNFKSPYFAQSVSEFWRRWHISLSTWFKDYLYIPLGGNRKGTIRKYINIMIVFLTSGLWHGASWNYVVWGGLNGIYQVIGGIKNYILSKLKFIKSSQTSFAKKLLKVIITFTLIDISWVFFRAASLKTALSMLKSTITVHNPWILFDNSLYKLGIGEKSFRLLIVAILILLTVDFVNYRGKTIREKVYNQPIWFRWIFYFIAIFSILIFGIWGASYSESSFIYFQF